MILQLASLGQTMSQSRVKLRDSHPVGFSPTNSDVTLALIQTVSLCLHPIEIQQSICLSSNLIPDAVTVRLQCPN